MFVCKYNSRGVIIDRIARQKIFIRFFLEYHAQTNHSRRDSRKVAITVAIYSGSDGAQATLYSSRPGVQTARCTSRYVFAIDRSDAFEYDCPDNNALKQSSAIRENLTRRLQSNGGNGGYQPTCQHL